MAQHAFRALLSPALTFAGLRNEEQLLRRNMKRFRGGLVLKAHRRLYHSTPGLRVIKKKDACQREVPENQAKYGRDEPTRQNFWAGRQITVCRQVFQVP